MSFNTSYPYNLNLEIFGIGLTLLAGVLTYFVWINGRWMKEMISKQKEMLNKQNEILNKHTEILNKQTEMLEKISEMLYKMDETLKVLEKNAEERHREVIELIRHLK
ncbi:MAG: hypothetical protein ABIN20_04100 [candidate division WOR-3 bacterium]